MSHHRPVLKIHRHYAAVRTRSHRLGRKRQKAKDLRGTLGVIERRIPVHAAAQVNSKYSWLRAPATKISFSVQ